MFHDSLLYNRKTKRTYNSDSRRSRAAQTRSRILTAAKSLFATEGFTTVSIEKIAKEASVSPSMVYTLFGSKHGVLRDVLDDALDPKTYNALLESVDEVESAEELLKIAAAISRSMYDAEQEMMKTFREASAITSEFKDLENEREERRYRRQEKSLKVVYKSTIFKNSITSLKRHPLGPHRQRPLQNACRREGLAISQV